MIQDYITIERMDNGIAVVVSAAKASFKTRLGLAFGILFGKKFSFSVKKENVRALVNAILDSWD